MFQQRITGFLWFPLNARSPKPTDQSDSTPATCHAPTNVNLEVTTAPQTPQTPPTDSMSKRKNPKKAVSKVAKRTAPSRKCKRTAQPKQPQSRVNSISSECPSSTNPVSDTQPSDNTTDNVSSVDRNSEPCDTTTPANDDVVFHERSLTDMLASAFDDNMELNSPNDHIAILESQLAITQKQLDTERAEKQHLASVADLLDGEINDYQKIISNQKKEIKRLNNENDSVRRDLSHFRGMKRYTTDGRVTPDIHKENASHNAIKDELDVTKAKLASLREHMMNVTSSLITALDGDTTEPVDLISGDDGFQEVISRRQRRRPQTEPSAASRLRPTTAYNQPQQQYAQGRPIPVIASGGPQVPSHVTSQSYSNAATNRHSGSATGPAQRATQPAPPPATYVIGTSLTRGLGGRLNRLGISNTTYTYAGAEIPLIRSRIPHILPQNHPPQCVVIQCGGNDAVKRTADEVIAQYDALISDVQRHCPTACIALSKIPLRGKNTEVFSRIEHINSYLQTRTTHGDGVLFIDACPESLSMFKKDLVHFSARGMSFYAQRMFTQLSNFTREHYQRVV